MTNQAQISVIGGGVVGDEPISFYRAAVDWIKPGGFAHTLKTSVALGMEPMEFAIRNDGWILESLGQGRTVSLTNELLFNANASRMQSKEKA